jgi:hypothetical protein
MFGGAGSGVMKEGRWFGAGQLFMVAVSEISITVKQHISTTIWSIRVKIPANHHLHISQ